MTIEEHNFVEVNIRKEPIIKQIELENVGFLQKESTFINCPACGTESMSLVRLEAVTCLQRILEVIKCCKSWDGRHDYNHYCSRCGCYIGRYVPVGRLERCISRNARSKAASGDMSLKQRQSRDCAESMQKFREHFLAQRAKNKAAKQLQPTQQQAPQQTLIQSTNGGGNSK